MPSACCSARPFAVARTKPRRLAFSRFSASVHATARSRPRPPLSPASSGWFEPDRQRHSPGAVATNRTLNVRPPSQKPYTRRAKPGPSSSIQHSTSV